MKRNLLLASVILLFNVGASANPGEIHAAANAIPHASDVGVAHASQQGLEHSATQGLGGTGGSAR